MQPIVYCICAWFRHHGRSFIVTKDMDIRENLPLAPFTTLGVGGPARYFLEVCTEMELREAIEFSHSKKLPIFVLGGGSNLVVADRGYDGVVIKIGLHGEQVVASDGDRMLFTVAAGEEWDAFVERAVALDCAGIECLSGIPGTVGGTPVQNVGAYGQEVAETITSVDALDVHLLTVQQFQNSDCGFGYRSSRFNGPDRGRFIVLRVCFALKRHGQPPLRYADLQKYFADSEGQPTLRQVRDAVRAIRHRKAMLLVPGDEDARSAGSFFKNPVVPRQQFEELSERLAQVGLHLPSYPAGDGFCKLPAAWLVEHAGFSKGYGKGAAGISRRHTLAIVNRGGATAEEIVALKNEIQAGVLERFGVKLHPEPVFVGF